MMKRSLNLVVAMTVCGLSFVVQPAYAGVSALQKCQKTILKETNNFLKNRSSKLGKCLEKRSAVVLDGADVAKAQALCEKSGATIESLFEKGVGKINSACAPVETDLLSSSDPIGLRQFGTCDPAVVGDCPTAAEIAVAYLCFMATESDYMASRQAPKAFGDLGALKGEFLPTPCRDTSAPVAIDP